MEGMFMRYHFCAFFFGFLLDLLVGDPYALPHPVRLIGKGICLLEKRWNTDDKTKKERLYRGAWMTLLLVFAAMALSGAVLFCAYWIHPLAGMAVEGIMTYQLLAAKCLKTESMKVYRQLEKGDLPGARRAVSMIVGRDTELLDEIGVIRAAVETVAENTSDGVIAPMLYLAVGGPVLGFLYKTINTMDSMVGYKNERYLYFGRSAAKLDDAANYLPSRISAGLMIAASFLLGFLPIRLPQPEESGKKRGYVFSGIRAVQIYRRDRRKHASPNSAQTESVCAGSLGIRLAGDASYFGKTVSKPYIGDPVRQVRAEDIRYANFLLYTTAWLCEIICLLILYLIMKML